jgi:hypothetical protein
MSVLASLGKTGIPIPYTEDEKIFSKAFLEIDSGNIITSKTHLNFI